MQAHDEIGDAADAETEIGGVGLARNTVGPGRAARSIDVVQALRPCPQRGLELRFAHSGSVTKEAGKGKKPCFLLQRLGAERGDRAMDRSVMFTRCEIPCL